MKNTSLLFIAFFAAITAMAQIPTTINFQGNLTEPGTTTPVADGGYTIDFALFNVATAGSAGWTETQTLTVTNGIFNVNLGALNPLDPGLFDKPLWLEITVGGETLSPRIELSSTAYSMNSANTESFTTPYTKIPDVGPVYLAGDTSTQNYPFAPGIIDLGIDDNDTGFDVPTDGNLSFYTNGVERMTLDFVGKLSIGDPPISVGSGTLLELNTDAIGTSWGGMWITNSAETGKPYYGYQIGATFVQAYTYLDGDDDNKWKLYSNGDRLTVQTDGNVGIGTTTPSEKLSVSGNIEASDSVKADVFAYNTPKTEYLFVPPQAFMMYQNNPGNPEYLNGFTDRYAAGAAAGNLVDIWAPIYLPHNSRIKSIEYYLFDNDVTHDHGPVSLYTVNSLASSTSTLIGSYTGSGGAQTISSGAIDILVDNSSEGLFLYSFIDQGTSLGTIRFRGARITYTVSE